MRIDKLHIEKFKNLIDFNIDLDETELYTILLGQNASGKSNFLEALVIIFRDLFLDRNPEFSYLIIYRCNGIVVKLTGDVHSSKKSTAYKISVQEKSKSQSVGPVPISRSKFQRRKEELLPKYLIAYYSGNNSRLKDHFQTHRKIYNLEARKGLDNSLRPLFYGQDLHSNLVLMAFFAFKKRNVAFLNFLESYLGIIDIESVLLVIRKPHWAGQGSRQFIENGKVSFWRAEGSVGELLKQLYNVALAPIREGVKLENDFGKKESQERVYIFLSSLKRLEQVGKYYSSSIDFFRVLESIHISDMIQDVRVSVKKKDTQGNIVFKELSEGEQQLLTVLGLLRFTRSEESLILLDEPDTHLNPLWKWRYIKLLRTIVEKPESTQIIMTTHDPLVVGSMVKEEIRLFYQEKSEEGKYCIKTSEPDFDPKGLGVAGILTSEYFGLPTILDEETYEDLEEFRTLQVKSKHEKATKKELIKLSKLQESLGQHGFSAVQRDPLYQRFIDAVYQIPELTQPPKDKAEREKQDKKMLQLLKELYEEEKS